jgi:hypothetical protein
MLAPSAPYRLRRCGEILSQLLARPNRALDKAFALGIFTDEINPNAASSFAAVIRIQVEDRPGRAISTSMCPPKTTRHSSPLNPKEPTSINSSSLAVTAASESGPHQNKRDPSHQVST